MNYTTDNSGQAIRFSKTSFSRVYHFHKPWIDVLDEKGNAVLTSVAAVSKLSIFTDI